MKRTKVSHMSKSKEERESLQSADKTCIEENKESDNKNDNTNKITESENNLQFTGTLTLEDISEGQSSNSRSSSIINNNNNNHSSNCAVPKLYTCENKTTGKGPKPEENKNNKKPTANSTESKCKSKHNSNPEGCSQGQTNNETDSISIACNGNSKMKGKRSKIAEKDNNKDKTGKLSGSKSKSKISDKPNSEDSSKDVLINKTEAIPQDVTAKHKRKEKRSKTGSSTRDSSVNKNKSDEQDLLEYFKAVESVNEGLEQRPEENYKSDRREDSSNRKKSKRSTESKSELKAEGKPSPDHSTDCQRTNINGARPKVFSAGRNGTKGKKPKRDVRRKDKTVIKSENESDEKDLLEYFKAVESLNEGTFQLKSTEHGINRRGCQVSSSPDQGGDKSKTNTQDKNLEMATTDTPDKFVKFIKTIAYQIIGNIERLIEEAKTMLEKKDFRLTRQKTLEAVVGAQEAKDQLLVFKNEFIRERNLADWFGTCAFILDKIRDFLAAAKCFYTDEQIDSAESRCRWKVCINICHDALNWEKFLRKEYNNFRANPLNKVRRLAISHFKLGEYKAARTYCMSILNDLTEFNDLTAFEIWARSLFVEENYDVALKKVELGLNCAKASGDTERLTVLRSEIQSSIPAPKENPEHDPDSLSGKLVKNQSNLEIRI